MNSQKGEEFKKISRRHSFLQTEIERHNRLYYVENRAEISDFEYDCLKAEFDDICQKYVEFSAIDKVGSDLGENGKIMQHLSPMLSLANTYSRDELTAFDERVIAVCGKNKFEYTVEPKIDGAAVNLIYEIGVLSVALTRGDGLAGEIITENVKRIKDVPQKLTGAVPALIEVRGEVYLTNYQFKLLNDQQEKLGLEQYANARNLASGSLKLLDAAEAGRRNLSFIAHGIGRVSEASNFKSQRDVCEALVSYGFKAFDNCAIACGIDEVWATLSRWSDLCKSLDYNTDGAVIKLNDRSLHDKLGATAKAPRWAIAYKFEPESAKSTVKDIVFQVGRTGVITPVAILTPTPLAGSTITRATLHNFNDLAKKDVRIGDTVVIQKAGEVIPAITKVLSNCRNGNEIAISLPQKCPECGANVTKISGEVFIRCTSSICPPQVRLKIVHFASKSAMDISGLGPKLIDKLVLSGFLKNISDVFFLKNYRNDISIIDRFSDKLVAKLLDEIEKSKKNPFWRLLHGLGIPNVGIEMSKNIAKAYKSLNELMLATFEDLVKIDLIGDIVADGILSFFKNEDNVDIAKTLIAHDVCCSPIVNRNLLQPNKFSNKKFVITGTLSSMTRDQAKAAIEALDGRVLSQVSKLVDALIVGKDAGSKYMEAQKHNIAIWDEQRFLNEIST